MRARVGVFDEGHRRHLLGGRDLGVRVDANEDIGRRSVVDVVGQVRASDRQRHGRPAGNGGRKIADRLPSGVVRPVVDVDEPTATRKTRGHKRQELHGNTLLHFGKHTRIVGACKHAWFFHVRAFDCTCRTFLHAAQHWDAFCSMLGHTVVAPSPAPVWVAQDQNRNLNFGRLFAADPQSAR